MPFPTQIKRHLAGHWQHHLLLWGLLLSLISMTIGAGATYAYHARGGFHWGILPPSLSVPRSAGGPIPVKHSLARFIVRIHNQGASSSCVGQTVSTIEEITTREHTHRSLWFSAGYIYDQVNGGHDSGTTYDQAFSVAHTQGDARLAAFPHDGQDWWVAPDPTARADATHHRVKSWRSISPADRYTISFEIAHGRPVAIAIPVTDSFYNQWLTPHINTVRAQYGPFHFWHSITAVAYDRRGVIILNSWGPSYGKHGLIRLSWSFLSDVGAAVVVSSPLLPPHHPQGVRGR
jgi:hypothetical protein